MQSATINYRSSTIHFLHAGAGSRLLLCFHGYGESAAAFHFLSQSHLLTDYKLIAIDMPYHGQTKWNDGHDFNPDDLLEIVRLASEYCGQHVDAQTRMTLLGFSLGGRVALTLYELMPQQVGRLVLLAPDGLKVNGWYWLATQTWAGNKLFAMTMHHPGWFFGLLKLMNRLKIVNASVYKFVKHYIGDEQARRLLYDRWTSLRRLRPRLTIIKRSISQNETPVRLLYGKHDRIILPVVGERFCQGIEKHCQVKVIASGHQVLQEKYIDEIVTALVQ